MFDNEFYCDNSNYHIVHDLKGLNNLDKLVKLKTLNIIV